MENISNKIESLPERDVFYFRKRQKNRVFTEIASFFADQAELTGITKRDIADRIRRDPAQITKWLNEPKNITLDTISDLLLSLGAEMDYRIVRFQDRAKPNAVHPTMAPFFEHANSINMEYANGLTIDSDQANIILTTPPQRRFFDWGLWLRN